MWVFKQKNKGTFLAKEKARILNVYGLFPLCRAIYDGTLHLLKLYENVSARYSGI
jgi:hypothetical protein